MKYLILAIAALTLVGCNSTRDKEIANSAATMYEAWRAHELGVDDEYVREVILSNAMAIIHATGHRYGPGELPPKEEK